MDSVLVVSHSQKGTEFFTQILNKACCYNISAVTCCSDARRLMLDRNFDICIINAPLPDENGSDFAVDICSHGLSQVILLVKSQYYDEISQAVEDSGVITVSKPINRSLFWSALKISIAAQNKYKIIQKENNKLLSKIEDIRIVDRAKCLLISYLGMSEPQAHKYIEQQAMDKRITKRECADRIIKTYDN